ncbi:hypothetical protein D3C87_1529120 [compost metagenome]
MHVVFVVRFLNGGFGQKRTHTISAIAPNASNPLPEMETDFDVKVPRRRSNALQ